MNLLNLEYSGKEEQEKILFGLYRMFLIPQNYNEVLTALISTIIAIPIGYAILNADKKDDSSNKSLIPGCLGLIFIGGGMVCLLPIVTWFISILSAVSIISFVAVVIIAIIALTFSKKKRII